MALGTLDLRAERKRLAGSYQPTEEERDALKVVDRHWDPEDQSHRDHEQQWVTNIAFLKGFQYLTWDQTLRQLVYAQTPSLTWRARAVHNFIRPYVKRAVASEGTFRPAYKVRPRNSDPENVQAARANSKIIQSYWNATGMNQKKYWFTYWKKVCGNCFIKVRWNRNGGEPLFETRQMQDADGNTFSTIDRLFEGDIESEIVSPFCVYFDAQAQCDEDLRWLIEARARPIEWVEENYPEKADRVPVGLKHSNVLDQQRWLMELTGEKRSSRNDDWVLVKEYWEVPSRDFPKGRLIVEANGVILFTGDNPTPKGLLPFVWIRDDLVPGELWAQCDVDNLLSMQRSYNRFVSKKQEHIVKTANAKVLEHSSNDIAPTAWRTEIGDVIKWHGITPPGYLVPPPLPPETDTEIMRIKSDFDMVTSQYGPARGQYQGKLSGKAIYTLIEADNQTKAPSVEMLALALAYWGKLVLLIAQEYVREPRLVKIVGRAEQLDVFEFQGQDIRDNTDVEIDVDSIRPKSRAYALEMIRELSQSGWLSPANPDDRTRVWKMLDMEDDAPLIEDKNQDLRRASIENYHIMQGVMVEPAQWWDDHDAHMLKHTEQAKSDEYKDAPAVIQEMLKAHMQSHLDIVKPRVGVTLDDPTMLEGPEMGGGGGTAPQAPPPARAPQPEMAAFS